MACATSSVNIVGNRHGVAMGSLVLFVWRASYSLCGEPHTLCVDIDGTFAFNFFGWWCVHIDLWLLDSQLLILMQWT